jgi:hypothetical protein
MKKAFFVFLLVSLTFTVYSQTGFIRELTGEVELKPAGSSVFIPAQPGNEVAQNTIISTGFRSTATVVVGSTEITVRPLTRLSLSEIQSSAGTENLNVNLQAGRIRVDVKPPAGTRANTTVQSPSATASVRGTGFYMDTRNLNVTEGKVAWQGNDRFKVLVGGGSSSTISFQGSAGNPNTSSPGNFFPPAPEGSGAAGEILTGGGGDAFGGEDGPNIDVDDNSGVNLDIGWGGGGFAGGGGSDNPNR